MGDTFVSDWGTWKNKMKVFFDARALFEAAKNETKFEEVKRNSPFADKIVVAVSYDSGGTSFYGDIFTFANANGGVDIASSIVKTAIRKKGWAVHDADSYLITFEKLRIFGNGDPGKVEIFWIGCQKPGVKSPESARRSK